MVSRSERVYLTIDLSVTTVQEDTSVSIRIQISAATVKALHTQLQQAYLKDDVRLVRRITVLIDLLVHPVPIAVLSVRWGLSASCLYDWQKAFVLHGLDSFVSRHSGGRRPKLTPKQKKPHSTQFSGEGPLPFAITLKLCRYFSMLGHQQHRPSDLRMTHAQPYPPDP